MNLNKYGRPKILCIDCASLGDNVDWSGIQQLGELITYPDTTTIGVKDMIKDADIVLTNYTKLSASDFDSAPNLKMIAILATGFDIVDIAAARDRGIVVCNVSGYSTLPVAQHVFALLLELCAGVCTYNHAVQTGKWITPSTFGFWDRKIVELGGKTLGIVGFGSIGQYVAKIGHAFGMNIIAYAPRPKPFPDYRPFEFVGLEELFRESDFVSLNCPHTPENTNMINKQSLSMMKPSAFLINCARGALVNEADLRNALDRGTIAGAALDVTVEEPMPKSSALFQAPNCIVTPHIAWASMEARTRLLALVEDNIRNFLAGKPINVVN